MTEIESRLGSLKIIPVVAIDAPGQAHGLAEALVEGGLPCAEITLRTDAGIEVLRTLSQRSDLLVGAGTVHSAEQAARVVDAGAQFVVSPGFNPKMVAWCIEHGIPVFPGTSTPTDLEMAVEFGLDVVKFFPAEAAGGVAMLKALSGPYGGIQFIPTGGIHAKNLQQYLRLPNVVACGGSWMVRPELLSGGRLGEIAHLTAEAVQLANQL